MRLRDVGTQFSPDRVYRYTLTRVWGGPILFDASPPLVVCMLNPSTADETQLDPTITRVCTRARAAGLPGVVVLNLFALRSTDPRHMLAAVDPVGPDNDRWLREVLDAAHREHATIVAAWGNHGAHRGRAWDVVESMAQTAPRWHAWGLTFSGQPRHPLYLPYVAELAPWTAPPRPPRT